LLAVGGRIRFLRAVVEAGLASVDTDLGKRTFQAVTLNGKSTQNRDCAVGQNPTLKRRSGF
jgi:hypothetical protein